MYNELETIHGGCKVASSIAEKDLLFPCGVTSKVVVPTLPMPFPAGNAELTKAIGIVRIQPIIVYKKNQGLP